MPTSSDETEPSPTFDAAMRVLDELNLSHPPVKPERVLAGLRLTAEPLPFFDVERLTPEQATIFRSVRGLLCAADRTIYLRSDLSERQAPWVIYHETGHDSIDWHREILYLDTMFTLSPRVRAIMEREANEFAGHLQFLGERFMREAKDLPFGLKSARELADRYEASYESAIRRYVETQTETCFCQVFEIVPAEAGMQTLKFRYFVKPRGNAPFWRPDYRIGERLPLDDAIVQLLNEGKLDGLSVYENTRFDQGQQIAYYEQVISNRYQVFHLTKAL